jgi:hypothetical protein
MSNLLDSRLYLWNGDATGIVSVCIGFRFRSTKILPGWLKAKRLNSWDQRPLTARALDKLVYDGTVFR